MKNDFLNIPADELLVPFPNFGAVLMQHGRALGDKAALVYPEKTLTYSELLDFCRGHKPVTGESVFSTADSLSSLLPLLCCLYHGKTVRLDTACHNPITLLPSASVSKEIPYVRLSDTALTVTEHHKHYIYSQYHILLAAQAIGKACHLFRPGKAVLPKKLSGLTDLTAGLLPCLYFGKSIEFRESAGTADILTGKAQYVYSKDCPELDGLRETSPLRDAVILTEQKDCVPYSRYIFTLSPSLACSGIGILKNGDGDKIDLLGLDHESDPPGGHLLVEPSQQD